MEKISIIHKASKKKIELTRESWITMGEQAGWIKTAEACCCGKEDCSCGGDCNCKEDCSCNGCCGGESSKED